MKAGKLRDKIRLERPVRTRNQSTGSISDEWALVAKRRATISPLNGSERAFLGSEMSETNAVIWFRFDSSMLQMSTEWRIVDEKTGRVYEIEYHDPVTTGLRTMKARCIHRSK